MLKNKNEQLTGFWSYLIIVWTKTTIKTQKEEKDSVMLGKKWQGGNVKW